MFGLAFTLSNEVGQACEQRRESSNGRSGDEDARPVPGKSDTGAVGGRQTLWTVVEASRRRRREAIDSAV